MSTRYLFLGQEGVLDGLVTNQQPTHDDLELEKQGENQYLIIKNGVKIVKQLYILEKNYQFVLAFHSNSAVDIQKNILNLLKEICRKRELEFPKFVATTVFDTKLYPDVDSATPTIPRNGTQITIAGYGKQSEAKSCVRNALSKLLNISESDRKKHIIVDNDANVITQAKREGWVTYQVSESFPLDHVINEIYNKELNRQETAPTEFWKDPIVIRNSDDFQVTNNPRIMHSHSLSFGIFIEKANKTKWVGKSNGDRETGDEWDSKIVGYKYKLGADFYRYFGVEVPEIQLSLQSIVNSDLASTSKPSVHVMSRFLDDFKTYKEVYGRSFNILKPNSERQIHLSDISKPVTEEGLGNILAVADLIYDINVIGITGKNIGFRMPDNSEYVKTIKLNPFLNYTEAAQSNDRKIRVADKQVGGELSFDDLPLGTQNEYISTLEKIANTSEAIFQEFFDREGLEDDAATYRTEKVVKWLLERQAKLIKSYEKELNKTQESSIEIRKRKLVAEEEEKSQTTDNDETNKDETKTDETTNSETKKHETNNHETKNDEAKNDEAKNDETKKNETKKDETTNHETKNDETKKDEAKNHETNNHETNNHETKNEETNNDETSDIFIAPILHFNKSSELPLLNALSAFINFEKGSETVVMLKGDSGAGKTSVLRYLEKHISRNREKDNQKLPKPIYVDLQTISVEDISGIFDKYSNIHPSEQNLLYLMDGYDEMIKQSQHDLFEGKSFKNIKTNSKVLITCRTSHGYQSWLKTWEEKEYKEYEILNFEPQMIKDYIEKFLHRSKPKVFEDSIQLLNKIDSFSGLNRLIKNPMILSMVTEVLPDLESFLEMNEAIRANRYVIYECFIDSWIKKQSQLINQNGAQVDNNSPVDSKGFKAFMIRIALMLSLKQVNTIKADDGENWNYIAKNEASASTCFSVLEKLPGNNYRFTHQSFLEYFTAYGIVEAIVSAKNLELVTPKMVVSSPAIIEYLKEANDAYSSIFIKCSDLLEESRSGEHKSPLASIAITFLNAVNPNLSYIDGTCLYIPGAILRNGIFDNVNFANAELRAVDFEDAWLRNASMKNSILKDVRFGGYHCIGLKDQVKYICCSPDDIYIGVAAGNNIVIFEKGSYKGRLRQSQILRGHKNWVTSCNFSPDSKRIVSGSWDHTIRIWDVEDAKMIQEFSGHTERVSSCFFSPDGTQILSGSWDKTIRIWEVGKELPKKILEGHTEEITCCKFSFDGKKIVSSSWDQSVRIWDANQGTILKELRRNKGFVSSCAFSPDAKLIISGGWDGIIYIWDASSGDPLRLLEAHTKQVVFCDFSPDGRFIVSGSWDRSVGIWDAVTGCCNKLYKGHTEKVNCCAFSLDGNHIISGSDDHTLRIWEVEKELTFQNHRGHTGRVTCCAFRNDKKQIVTGSEDNTVRIWRPVDGSCVHLLKEHSDAVTSCAFNNDGTKLVSGSRDTSICIWNSEKGRLITKLQGHTDYITDCTFSPDNRKIASASLDSTIRLWDVDQRVCIKTIRTENQEAPTSCNFSPNSPRLVSGHHDNQLRIWDIEKETCLNTLEKHVKAVNSCAFSPDGSMIVSGSDDKSIIFWDSANGHFKEIIDSLPAAVTSCKFVQGGKYLISVCQNNTVQIWDLEKFKSIFTLQGFESKVVCASIHQIDSHIFHILIGNEDGTVQYWAVNISKPSFKGELIWASHQLTLNLQGLSIEGAKGLTEANLLLLKQKKANLAIK